jgi:hypothetical protein
MDDEMLILWPVSESVFLKWFSCNKECGNSLVTGLLRNMFSVTDIDFFGY